ncbi:MAG TPA: transcriptional repressor [Puia sp.]|uniref:Fur family transcriptional regulator n=1 Tax=Puia sp. TaxID=2045100 RepID=UPI002C5FC05E|nr:transcriptional repressor [Puia sp.]HVU94715.1 transcriptional repressor [Puia sp.]
MNRRNTASKEIVLHLLERYSSALSQDFLEDRVRGQMDRVTIYRVLNRFCEDGIVHKFMSDEGKYYYALCRGCSPEHHSHDHIHFRCLHCDTVECLPNHVRPKLPEGYTGLISNYWISGYCRKCAPGQETNRQGGRQK